MDITSSSTSEWFDSAATGNLHKLKNLTTKNEKYLNIRDAGTGKTAVHFAAETGKLRVLRHLLESGANANDADDSRKTPMDCVGDTKRRECIKLLKKHDGCFLELDLYKAAEFGDIDSLEGILEEDETIKINGRDEKGWMAIHYAVDQGDIETVKFLIENKANVNGGTLKGGLNCYEIAKDNEDEEMLTFLKSKGALANRYRKK
jgi:ankyrin repeat protein|tara:strand:- start:10 stop:621 length:612 start_codon:yes stop_codon:yes gene_type:complete